jgi:hypothetical protein
MMSLNRWFLLLTLAVACPCAEQRDFLRVDEADRVREAQEPNERLPLYMKFAADRISMIRQFLASQKAGRGSLVRDVLDEYTSIIDAVDAVTDDALRAGKPVDKGLQAVVSGERQALSALRGFAAGSHQDMQVFRFTLEQAIIATSESLDSATQDLGKRSSDIKARDNRERQQREASMTSAEAESRRAEDAKETEQKKRVPTLRRPGEAAPPKD